MHDDEEEEMSKVPENQSDQGMTQAIAQKIQESHAKQEKREEWEDFAGADSTHVVLEGMNRTPVNVYLEEYADRLIAEQFSEDERPKEKIIAGIYKANGMPKQKCTPGHIRFLFTEEGDGTKRILEFGMGLNLSAEEVELLMQKALARAGFNYFDPEEMLAYCVFAMQKKERWNCYQALLAYYRKAEPEAGVSGRMFSNTETVKDWVKNELKRKMTGRTIYKGDDFSDGNLDDEMKSFIARHKAEMPESRTAAVVFMELYEEFIHNNEMEIYNFKKVDRRDEEYAKGEVDVVYEAGSEILLPKGTVFYAVKTRGGRQIKIRFVTHDEKKLPAKRTANVVVKVRGAKEFTICEKKKETQGYVKNGEKLELQHPENNIGIIGIQTKGTLSYKGIAGEQQAASGTVSIECTPGTKINRDMGLIYGDCEYITLEEATALVTETVEVWTETPYKDEEKVTETGTIIYMENQPEEIVSVFNRKPVNMKAVAGKKKGEKKDNPEKITINKEVFRQYLYVEDASRLNEQELSINPQLLGPWFRETMIRSDRLTKIENQAACHNSQNSRYDMRKNEVRRCDIITLAFLNFCTKEVKESVWKEGDFGFTAEQTYKDFVMYVNEKLARCGMLPFYIRNPYEQLLAYLIQTDTPMDTLRNLWKIVNGKRGE